MREPRKSPWAPKNKLIGIEYEDKAHYVVEEQDVMRSHYCRTDTRRLDIPEGTTIADLNREFKSRYLRTRRRQAMRGFMVLWEVITTSALKSLRTTGKISLYDYCTFFENTRNPTQAQMEKYERHIISKEESNHGGNCYLSPP